MAEYAGDLSKMNGRMDRMENILKKGCLYGAELECGLKENFGHAYRSCGRRRQFDA